MVAFPKCYLGLCNHLVRPVQCSAASETWNRCPIVHGYRCGVWVTLRHWCRFSFFLCDTAFCEIKGSFKIGCKEELSKCFARVLLTPLWESMIHQNLKDHQNRLVDTQGHHVCLQLQVEVQDLRLWLIKVKQQQHGVFLGKRSGMLLNVSSKGGSGLLKSLIT